MLHRKRCCIAERRERCSPCLIKANIAQRKKNDRQVILLSALFYYLFVYLDVRMANIGLGHDHRVANIG
jgi:hypothetical protein